MAVPFVVARCISGDFINPFTPWAWTATVCALFLAAEVATVGLLRIGPAPTGRGRAARWLPLGALLVVGVAASLIGAFAAWSWMWSGRFVIWCDPEPRLLHEQYEAAQQIARWGQGALAGTGALLLLGLPLVLLAGLRRRARTERRSGRQTTGL